MCWKQVCTGGRCALKTGVYGTRCTLVAGVYMRQMCTEDRRALVVVVNWK